MIGEGYRTMHSTKRMYQHFTLWLVMLSFFCTPIANALTTDVKITATFIVPTCELVVPSVVYLGSMKNGLQSYNPFNFQVNCSTPTNTAVFAQALGALDTNSIDTTLMEGSGVKFWLKDNASNKNITLNGESGEVFCSGSNSRTCTLTPNTLVKPENPRGETYTTILLNIRYET